MRNEIKTLRDLKKSYEKLWSERDFVENKQYYQWILSLLKAKSEQKVLDVGCGAGYFIGEAQKKKLICYGLDISETAVKIAKRRCRRCDIQQGVAEKLPYKDKYFDYVVCLGSLEHFLKPKAALREIKRVLKDDGEICIVVPNKWAINDIMRGIVYGIDQDHGQEMERFFTYNEILEMLNNAGFLPIKVYGYNQPDLVKIRTGTILSFSADLIYRTLYKLFRNNLPVRISYSFVFLLKKR